MTPKKQFKCSTCGDINNNHKKNEIIYFAKNDDGILEPFYNFDENEKYINLQQYQTYQFANNFPSTITAKLYYSSMIIVGLFIAYKALIKPK